MQSDAEAQKAYRYWAPSLGVKKYMFTRPGSSINV